MAKTKQYLQLVPALFLLLASGIGMGFSYYLAPLATKAAGSTTSETLWIPTEYMGVTVTSYPYLYRDDSQSTVVNGLVAPQTRSFPTTARVWTVVTCVGGGIKDEFKTAYHAAETKFDVNWREGLQMYRDLAKAPNSLEQLSLSDTCNAPATNLMAEIWTGASIDNNDQKSRVASSLKFRYVNLDSINPMDYPLRLGFIFNPPNGQNPFVNNWVQGAYHGSTTIFPNYVDVDPVVNLPIQDSSTQMTEIKMADTNDEYFVDSNIACLRAFYPTGFGTANGNIDWNYCPDSNFDSSWDMNIGSRLFVTQGPESMNVDFAPSGGNMHSMPVSVWIKNTGWLISAVVK